MSDTDTATTDATDDAPEELPGDGLRESIVDALRADLGDALVDTHLVPQSDLWVRVAREAWADVGAALKSHGFDYFCFLSAIDWMPSPYGKGEEVPGEEAERDTEIRQGVTGGDTRFQLFARVTDIRRHVSVTVKSDVPDSMTMPTWIPFYAGANWHERETHEMFGIGFDGHPDLRNIYLPGDFEGNPLRKDFPLLARMIKPWPGIVDVEPIPDPDEEPAAGDPAVESAVAEVGEADVNENPQRAEGNASDTAADESAAVDTSHGGSGRTPPAGGPDHGGRS